MRELPLLCTEYSGEDKSFIRDGVTEILESGYLTMDKKVAEFERQFCLPLYPGLLDGEAEYVVDSPRPVLRGIR